MRKISIFILLGAVVMFNSCSKEETKVETKEEKNARIFEESVMIVTTGRIYAADGNSARTFMLNIFDKEYIPKISYTINGVDFTDDGKYNDQKAGDGVYTAVTSEGVKVNEKVQNYGIVTDKFKANTGTAGSFPKPYVKITCKMRTVYTGTSLLGFSCESGCIEFYDCEFEIGWS